MPPDPAPVDRPAPVEPYIEPSVDLAEPVRTIDRPHLESPPPTGGGFRSAPGGPASQVEVHLARAVQGRIERLVVQLEPVDLGRIEIRLEFGEEGRVGAVISAERPETLDALQRDAASLERSLRDAGLRPDSGGLSFGLQRDQQEKRGAPTGRPVDPATFGQAEVAEPDAPPDHRIAHLRLLDIRA